MICFVLIQVEIWREIWLTPLLSCRRHHSLLALEVGLLSKARRVLVRVIGHGKDGLRVVEGAWIFSHRSTGAVPVDGSVLTWWVHHQVLC